MKPLTVNALIELLTNEKKNGHGEYAVMVSDDEECNGFHLLWGFYPIEYGEPTTFADGKGRHTIETILLS